MAKLFMPIVKELFDTLPEWDVPDLWVDPAKTYYFRDSKANEVIQCSRLRIRRYQAHFVLPKDSQPIPLTADTFSDHYGMTKEDRRRIYESSPWDTKMVNPLITNVTPSKIGDYVVSQPSAPGELDAIAKAIADPLTRMTPVQQYAYLSIRLTIAQVEHGNDSPEADAIREDMDKPWYTMSDEDRSKISAFNTTINSFDFPEPLASVSVPANNSGNTDPVPMYQVNFDKSEMTVAKAGSFANATEPVANAIDGSDVPAEITAKKEDLPF